MARRHKVGHRPSAADPLALESRQPTKLQRRALQVLENAYAQLTKCLAWHGRRGALTLEEVEGLSQDPHYDMAWSEWLRAVLRAARSGVLGNKELVESSPAARVSRERIRDWQALGQKDFLRMARIGLEHGVKFPCSPREVRLSAAILEKLEDRSYLTVEAVRLALIKEGVITASMTKRPFHGLLDGLEFRADKYIDRFDIPEALLDRLGIRVKP